MLAAGGALPARGAKSSDECRKLLLRLAALAAEDYTPRVEPARIDSEEEPAGEPWFPSNPEPEFVPAPDLAELRRGLQEEAERLEAAWSRLENYGFLLEMEKRTGGRKGLDDPAKADLVKVGTELDVLVHTESPEDQARDVERVLARVLQKINEIVAALAAEQRRAELRSAEMAELERTLLADCSVNLPPLPRNWTGREILSRELIERAQLSDCGGNWYGRSFRGQSSIGSLAPWISDPPAFATPEELALRPLVKAAVKRGLTPTECALAAANYLPPSPLSPAVESANDGRWVRRGSGEIGDQYVFGITGTATPSPSLCSEEYSFGRRAVCWDGVEHRYDFKPPSGFSVPFCAYYREGSPASDQLMPDNGAIWVCDAATAVEEKPPAAAPPAPETGPLPFERRPTGAPIMSAGLIDRYLAARRAANAHETAYWRAGRFDTFGYTDVETRISLWLRVRDTPQRFEHFSDDELAALEAKGAEILSAYNG